MSDKECPKETPYLKHSGGHSGTHFFSNLHMYYFALFVTLYIHFNDDALYYIEFTILPSFYILVSINPVFNNEKKT